jgi:hypothetical protein
VFLIAVVVAVGWRETRKEYVVLSAVDDVRGCRANFTCKSWGVADDIAGFLGLPLLRLKHGTFYIESSMSCYGNLNMILEEELATKIRAKRKAHGSTRSKGCMVLPTTPFVSYYYLSFLFF